MEKERTEEGQNAHTNPQEMEILAHFTKGGGVHSWFLL